MIIVSTKNVFRGALCLYTTVAAINLEAQSTECKKQYWSVAEAINEFNQKSWRIIGHNKIVDADKDSWIKDTKYEESITKVIGEAIGKCLSDTGEFANKNSSDTVTFAVTHEQTEYTPENWNAVVLWNYLNQLKWNFVKNRGFGSDEIFNRTYNAVFRYYNDDYADIITDLDDKIQKAISDIKEYAKALDLESYMQQFVTTVQKLKDKNVKSIYKDVRASDNPGNPKVYISPIMTLCSTDYPEKNPFCFNHIRGIVDRKHPLKVVSNNKTYKISRPFFDWGKEHNGADKNELKRKVKEIRDTTYGDVLPENLQSIIYNQALKIL